MLHHDCLSQHVLTALVFVFEVGHQHRYLLGKETVFEKEVEFFGLYVGIATIDFLEELLYFKEERDFFEQNELFLPH